MRLPQVLLREELLPEDLLCAGSFVLCAGPDVCRSRGSDLCGSCGSDVCGSCRSVLLRSGSFLLRPEVLRQLRLQAPLLPA